MKGEILKAAVKLAEKLGHVFVATSDAGGLPHVAAAGKMTLEPQGRVAVTAWFCPGTMNNLQVNHHIALVVWDANEDFGYQLLGESEKVEDLAFLNGYAPEIEDRTPIPQVERQLLVRVDKIIDFRHAPHSDVEE